MALTETDKNEGRYVLISQLELAVQEAMRGWIKGINHEVLLIRRGFTNKDGSSDLACDGGQASVLYQRRWKLEEFH
jgi:hypothetical protein